MAHQRQEQAGAVGEVQVECLSRHPGLAGHVAQLHVGAPFPSDQAQGGVEMRTRVAGSPGARSLTRVRRARTIACEVDTVSSVTRERTSAMASDVSAAPHLRLANRHTGEVLLMRRQRRNGEAVLDLQGTLPPHREGPPMHIHYLENEEGRVTAGRLSADVGGTRVVVEAGGAVRLPKGVPHRWWNDGDEPLAFEGSTQPAADLHCYLQAIFECMNAGPPNRPPLFYLAHAALRHRRTQAALVMPLPLQAVLFRMVVAVGTILGRYRGTAWPGCPARLTGAPES